MKKIILLSALMATFGTSMAQELQTYSVYDTDQSGSINVGDALGVADKVVNDVAADKTQQYVTADDLRALLQGIDAKLEQQLTKLNGLEADVAALKEKMGIGPNAPDENGIVSKGHEYVDLGITDAEGKTIYWATCNVGADSPEEYGLYFAWGATTGCDNTTGKCTDHTFNWANAPFNGGNSSYSESAWNAAKSSAVDANNNLLPANDAATANWGGSWRMPTTDENQQLWSQCYWQWVTSYNGKSVNGYVVYKAKAAADKGKHPYYDNSTGSYVTPTPVATYSVSSDAHIFLPAAGDRVEGSHNMAGYYGFYWSGSLNSSASSYAYYLNLNSSGAYYGSCDRYLGQSVRPVCQ